MAANDWRRGPKSYQHAFSRSTKMAGWRKPRTCLKCGKTFDSQGPHNRVCKSCSWKQTANCCDDFSKDTFEPRIHKLDPAMKATLRGMTKGMAG